MRMPDKKWSLQIHFSYRKAAVFLLSLSRELGLPQRKYKQGGIFPATIPPAYIFPRIYHRFPTRASPLHQKGIHCHRAFLCVTPYGVTAGGLETATSKGMAQHLRQVLEGQRED